MAAVHPPPRQRQRRYSAIACLLILLAAEAASFRAKEFRGRWGALFFFAGKSAEDAILGGSGFAFDRRLGPFLHAVETATPPDSTVALPFAGPKGNLATYAAAYVLAPRRIVGFGRIGQADFAALYRPRSRGTPAVSAFPARPSTPVPFGELARLR